MNISFKFDVEEYVYFFRDNKVDRALIIGIIIHKNRDTSIKVSYSVICSKGDTAKIDENVLFGSREELLEYVTEELEKLIVY